MDSIFRNEMPKDTTPRYTPDAVMTVRGRHAVTGVATYPPNQHPSNSPIREDVTAIELKTIAGSRWYGADKAFINSELRMVVVGFPAKFEEMARWEVAKVVK